MATPIKFAAQVTRVIRHSPEVATYEFSYMDKRPRYKPGQFLHLALNPYDPTGYWPESRVFTIARGATQNDFLRLTISAKGRFTARILRELEVGQKVWLKAPYGEFIVHTDPKRETVLIAGGTGVSPFVAFMEDALIKGTEGAVWLHYGARQPELLAFRELADRCAASLPGFQVRYYAEQQAGEGIWPGRIDLRRAVGLLKEPAQAVFYLCGPQAMIDGFRAELMQDLHVEQQNIRVDQWE